jgi:hypothetical protein
MPEESGHTVEHRPDHVPAPAPLAADVAAGEAIPEIAGGAGLLDHPDIGGRGNAPVRSAMLQRMQQQYGNRAVQRFLQRTPAGGVPVQRDNPPPAGSAAPAAAPAATPVSPLTADMFTVEGGTPSLGGAVKVEAAGDKVKIDAPEVKFDAKVTMKSDAKVDPAEFVQAGPVQTILGANRTGIYRLGGAKDGKIVAEYHNDVGQMRDAVWNKKTKKASFPAPWYSEPQRVSAGSDANIHFMDQPGFELPRKLGAGILTETSGQDRFITSVAVKNGSQVQHLRASHWEVPWTATIDAANQGPGAAVTGGDSPTGPPTMDGPIAIQADTDRMRFHTLDAAMGASAELLLDNLVSAKSEDPQSWANIAEALRRKNVTFQFNLKVNKAASIGNDDIRVTIKGHQQVVKGPFSLGKGGSAPISVTLTELFDPAMIDAGTTITVTAQDVGWISHDALTISWPYPFYNQEEEKKMAGDAFSYTITARRN